MRRLNHRLFRGGVESMAKEKTSKKQTKQSKAEQTSGKTRRTPDTKDFDEAPLKRVKAAVERATKQVRGIRASMPWLGKMDSERRRFSRGKLRDGENAALLSVADLVGRKEWEGFFRPLAKMDKGKKPGVLEIARLKERLERRALYVALLDEIGDLWVMLSDTILYEGENVKPVLLKAYSLARKAAEDDEEMRTALADVIDFYGEPAKKATKTKAEKKAQEEAERTAAEAGEEE
jgi:hypothetical protein